MPCRDLAARAGSYIEPPPSDGDDGIGCSVAPFHCPIERAVPDAKTRAETFRENSVSKTSSAASYSVQPVAQDGQPDKSICIHVDAEGPVRAAEIALGETLCVHGSPENARAKVWHLSDDFSPVSVTLFRPATVKA